MTSGGSMTPPQSPRGDDGTTPVSQTNTPIVLRTPGLESSRRRSKESQEAIKRRRELRTQVMAKQAELEELLLLMDQEKGKKVTDAQESDSDKTYDPLYDSLGDEAMDDDDTLSASESEIEAAQEGILRQELAKAPLRPVRQPDLPPPLKDNHEKSFRKQHVPTKKSSRQKQYAESSESSSSDDTTPVRVKKHGKDKVIEASPFHAWDGSDQSTRMMARRALGRISASPFTEEICEAEPPRKFQTPRFTAYNGRSDPLAHYRHYMQAMTLWSWNDELMCRVFPSSLGDVALQWFHKLPPGSIACWEQLAEEFVTRFLANAKQPKTADILLTMRRKSTETLRDYSRRYMELYNEVEGCTEQLAVTSFKLGLQKTDRLWLSLTKKPAVNMSELMCRIEKYAKVEDEIRPAEQKDARPSISSGGSEREKRPEFPGQRKSVFEAVNTVFKEPIFRILPQIQDKPYFRWPRKLPDFKGKEQHKDFCSYHQDRGHRTGGCKALRYFLEELVRDGHLKEYIDHTRPGAEDATPREQRGDQRRHREEV